MHLSSRTSAIFALIMTGILGGVSSLFMKVALKEFNSYQILFIRFGIATLLIIPLFVKHLKVITTKTLRSLIPAGILFSINVLFFVVAIQYTTSVVSQLFYLLVPVFVSLFSYFLFKEKISLKRIVSMIICFGGSSLLILESIKGSSLVHSIGTFHGNILILCSVISWSTYLVYTKRLSKQIAPSLFLVINFTIALVIAILFFIITKISFIVTIVQFSHSSLPVMLSLLALASVNSVVCFFLYQWSLKHVSAFIVASTTYIAPVAAAVFAIPFFGERLSGVLIISAVSIFLGSYLILTEKK